MPEASMVFPASEFRQRTARLQAEMAAQGLDGLLLTMPSDIFYLSGFLTRFWESPARPWFLLVGLGRDPIAVIPSIGFDLMRRTWISDIRTWAAPDPRDDGVTLLADALREVVPEHGCIGVPIGLETHLRMPLADFDALRDMISPRIIVDGTGCIQRTREIKSPLELEKIRRVCAIAGRAFERVPEFALQGRGLDRVFRDFQSTLLQEGADWVSYLAGAAAPEGYGDVISPATGRPLEAGDVLMLDTGAVCDGYFCDFDRNFSIGSATDAAKRAHHGVWQATEDTLHKLEAGMRAKDAWHLLSRALERQGLEPGEGRLGHGLGLNLTEWPSLTPLDDTVLRAGMVLTLEPSAKLGAERFMVHEENLVLHENSVEVLSPRAPYDIPEIIQ